MGKRKIKWSGEKRRELIRRVLASHGDRCYICGLTVLTSLPKESERSATLDHVVPLSKGGSLTGLHNLRLVHKNCNHWKAEKTVDELGIKDPRIQTDNQSRCNFVLSSGHD